MRRIGFLVVLILFSLALVSCDAKTEVTSSLKVPSPGADSGVVVGQLKTKSGSTQINANLYLSKNITEGRTDIPPVFSFSYQSNPRGVIDENGYFYFANVPAGKYVITLWIPPGQAEFVKNSSGDDYIWVVVKAGTKTDTGTIIIP